MFYVNLFVEAKAAVCSLYVPFFSNPSGAADL